MDAARLWEKDQVGEVHPLLILYSHGQVLRMTHVFLFTKFAALVVLDLFVIMLL